MTIKMALAVATLSILMPWGVLCAQAAGPANQPIAAELQPLQGSWEGVLVGQETAGKISITITDNLLHFQRMGSSQWYEATLTMPAGTYPQQLHATIKDCPEPCDDIGKVVFAIFKIEDGTLTLVGIQASAVEPPKTFGEIPGFDDNRIFRYKLKKAQPSILRDELKKVQPPKKVTQSPKSNGVELRVFSLAGEHLGAPRLPRVTGTRPLRIRLLTDLVAAPQGVMVVWNAMSRLGGEDLFAAGLEWEWERTTRSTSLPADRLGQQMCGRVATNGNGDWAAAWKELSADYSSNLLVTNEGRTFDGPLAD